MTKKSLHEREPVAEILHPFIQKIINEGLAKGLDSEEIDNNIIEYLKISRWIFKREENEYRI